MNCKKERHLLSAVYSWKESWMSVKLSVSSEREVSTPLCTVYRTQWFSMLKKSPNLIRETSWKCLRQHYTCWSSCLETIVKLHVAVLRGATRHWLCVFYTFTVCALWNSAASCKRKLHYSHLFTANITPGRDSVVMSSQAASWISFPGTVSKKVSRCCVL